MKSIIKRRAKSVLAILLTLCMVMSVFTIGIVSASAATDDSEAVGLSDLSTVIFDNSKTKWTNVYLYICETNYVRSYQMTATGNSSVYVKTGLGQWASRQNMFFASVGNYDNGSSYNNANTASIATLASGGNYTGRISASDSDANKIYYPASATNGATLSKADAYVLATGASGTYSGLSTTSWSNTEDVMNYDGSNYFITYENKDPGNYAVAVVKYNDWNTKRIGQGTATNCTLGSYDNNLTITTTKKSNITISTATSATDVDVNAAILKIASPTNVKINNVTESTVNASGDSTLTWTAVSGAASYEVYKGGSNTPVGSPATNSYTIENTTANAGTYTVKAVPTDTGYDTSDASSPVTLTVYEPQYCLVGNVNQGSIKIGDDVFVPTEPTGSASYWNTWQDGLVVSTPTDTPGKYSITFTANEEAERTGNPNIGLYLKNTGQKAFILNGTPYNTSNSDLTITDDGITDDDNLYVNNLGSPAGGSLVFKRGQTYTITIDQTQRYDNNSSYPWGKITITTTDVFADVAAKKQAFNATTRQYESAANCETTIGTASARPVHDASSLTTQLTAELVNSNYEFIGWYNTTNFSGSPDIAANACDQTGNTYTKQVTIRTTTEYYALFKQKMPTDYSVTVSQPSFCTISLTGGVASTSSNPTTAYQGATVSINATVDDNSKEFSHWLITVDTQGGTDITSTVCANPTQTTTTFTMPAQNVNITAIYSNKTPINISVTSSNDSLGSASNTPRTYYVGDPIPIKADPVDGPKGGVFVKWIVTGGAVTNATSATTTITQTGATVTARAVFEYKTFQLHVAGIKYTMLRQSNGTYVSTRTVTKDSGTFTVYDVSDDLYARPSTSINYDLHSGYTSNDINSWDSSSFKYQIRSDDSAAYYVIFNPSGATVGTISISTTNPLGTIAQVYAKDGTVRYASGTASSGDLWADGGAITAQKGSTTIKKINDSSVLAPDSTKYSSTNPAKSENLKIYSAPIGSTITIETVVGSTYVDQGFYVGMFVINGWKVAASDMGNGKYTATYTLSDEYDVIDTSSNKSFEITPVYYNKNFEYVTFYVDAKSVPSKWKGTISTCADYRSTDGTSAASSHFEGSYPGQPLGREGDLYEIKVAKYYYDSFNSTTKKWTVHTNYYPSATITAYNYDVVHHYYYVQANNNLDSADTNSNYQTYDYADFSYLAQIPNIEAIMFRCKPETSKNNWQIYDKSDNQANYDPNDTEPEWQNVSSNDMLNTWQWLTDYYGNPVDAFGNRIEKTGGGYYTAEDLTNLNPTTDEGVRIVSYGNKQSTGTSTVRTKAQWATGWVVYTKGSTSGTKYYKAYGTPADFICTTPGNTSTANVTGKYYSSAQESDIKGKLTVISYDKERTNKIGGINNTGIRIDGQWYYSAMHDFDSNVQVHITTDEGTVLTDELTNPDADSNSANNTGWIGTTSGTKATLDGKTKQTYSNVTTEASLDCTLGAGYTFVGWYIYDGTTYTKIGDNYADLNTTMTMKKNYTIVAVVKKVPLGSLVITHSKYTGTNPMYGGETGNAGTGKYYVSAKIYNSSGTLKTTIPEAQNSIPVTNLSATDKIEITIRTVCDGDDTFYAWYEEDLGANYARTGKYYEICSEQTDPKGEKEVTYTMFMADCSSFFSGNSLARQTIDFYSDITHVSAYANLTYKYYDRFDTNGKGKMAVYTVKNVELTAEEIDNGYIPSDEKIAKYAPKVVDTIYTDTKWTITGTKVDRAASNVTLMATQTPKNCYVLYLPNNIVANNLLQSLTKETLVGDVVPWNSRTVPFNSWLIDENADIDNPHESDFYVNAPKSYTFTSGSESVTWKFERFDVYSYDRLTGEIGNVIYSSNDNYFGYRIYADCVIYPVYTTGNVATELTAKIEPAVLNREVYGDSASPVDRLYADLLISFINISSTVKEITGGDVIPEEIKDLPANSGYTIETGVILDKRVNLNDTDFNTLKHAAENGEADTTSTIIAGYDGFTSIEDVRTFARDTAATSGTLTRYQNNATAVQTMTNKNRLDKVFRYTNTEAAQKRVFAAYSYIVIRKTNGDLVASAVSNQQRFNFCYVGNKPLETAS